MRVIEGRERSEREREKRGREERKRQNEIDKIKKEKDR